MRTLSVSVNLRLISPLIIVLALAHVHVHAKPNPGPINSLNGKTDTDAGSLLGGIESDEGSAADSLLEPQAFPLPSPNAAAAAAAEAALLELDQEIHGDTDADPATELVRERRTIRFLTRIWCMFFRSSASCVQPEPVSSSSTDNDDFWLNYLNSNGTDTPTTTTPRPTLWGRKREFLRMFFPNLFPERRGGGGGFLSGLLGGGGLGGGGGGGGGILASILQVPMRLFRSFSGATGFGGGGYSNDF